CYDTAVKESKDWFVQDCSAATENMLIAAASLDLGAVWLGVYPRNERVEGLKKLLNLPENLLPFSLIPIGYPAETKSKSRKFKPEKVLYLE
ncbi:MAG: nitroreductase family protein, partial [Candidatus Wallbacteria bacterium]|nr:nitroreductase family protein [Candidatus Wallbacteria bacterium]